MAILSIETDQTFEQSWNDLNALVDSEGIDFNDIPDAFKLDFVQCVDEESDYMLGQIADEIPKNFYRRWLSKLKSRGTFYNIKFRVEITF